MPVGGAAGKQPAVEWSSVADSEIGSPRCCASVCVIGACNKLRLHSAMAGCCAVPGLLCNLPYQGSPKLFSANTGCPGQGVRGCRVLHLMCHAQPSKCPDYSKLWLASAHSKLQPCSSASFDLGLQHCNQQPVSTLHAYAN
jgi:hypothetical protein